MAAYETALNAVACREPFKYKVRRAVASPYLRPKRKWECSDADESRALRAAACEYVTEGGSSFVEATKLKRSNY